MLNRRRFTIACAAALPGCSQVREKYAFRQFTRGDPKGIPLVVAPAGPKGLGQYMTEEKIDRFAAAGFYVIGAHWPGLDGGEEDYGAHHREIAAWLRGLNLAKPLMYAHSRGGLQLLNFACDHPDSFSKIACLYPVTDPYVYPGRGPKLWSAHDAWLRRFDVGAFSPNARAAALRGRPIKIWHGDSDKLVPKHLTTDVFAPQCGAEVVTLRGVGHVPLWVDEIPAWLKT